MGGAQLYFYKVNTPLMNFLIKVHYPLSAREPVTE